MTKRLLLLLCLLSGTLLCAQPVNFGVEQRTADGRPVGWSAIGETHPMRLDSVTVHGGRYALRVTDKGDRGFGGVTYKIPVQFGGRKITLTAFVKTDSTGLEPNTFASLWMRIDDVSGNRVAFDNMQRRGIIGTTDWKQYTITLPLPDEAKSIYLGGLLVGKGTVWFDDFDLKVDGKPLEKAPVRVATVLPAQTDTTFDQVSGVDLTTLTNRQIDNLTVLGRVWGFVKYYHPAVAAGNHNMDAELFRVMPAVLKAVSPAQRDDALLTWLKTFGPVKAASVSLRDTAKAAQLPDLAWLTDPALLSAPLRTQLTAIRQAKRPAKSYYISMAPHIGNPVFTHEMAYRRMTTPDAGYRLLTLYRFWTIIQYFFPYKHLITSSAVDDSLPGSDWNNVLSEFIPVFANARDSLTYRLAALAMIGRIHDTHANVWGDPIVEKYYKGTFYAPVQVKYIAHQFVVANYYNDSLGTRSGLRRGDAINKIDGVPVATLVGQRRAYYPASNEPTRLRDICRNLLRGHTNTVALEIDRDGQPVTIRVARYPLKDIPNYRFAYDGSSYPKDSSWQLLSPDIGYLFLGTINARKLPEIMQALKGTKGLIIDLRCYPSEFVVFALGKYLTTPVPFVQFTLGSEQMPGLFTWHAPLKVGQRGVDTYTGKIVILVNEETQSSAEYHTMAFRQAPNALVLGSTTAAADGDVSPVELPGGLRTMISGIGVHYPDGRETQRVGISIDVGMQPTRQGIKAGKDELLDKAIDLIRAGK